MEAVLAIVTNSGETSAKWVALGLADRRLRPEVVPSLVDKVLGNTRAATKKKGTDLCAMFVEVENGGEGVVVSRCRTPLTCRLMSSLGCPPRHRKRWLGQ